MKEYYKSDHQIYKNIKSLYIIGNGFDLFHHIPTNYSDFQKFISKSISSEWENYFKFQMKQNYWCNFENDLETFDYVNFYKEFNCIDISNDNFKPSEVFSLEDAIEQEGEDLISQIRIAFEDWISSISLERTEKVINLDTEAYFINFNYTSTLEKVYEIPSGNIWHIHGDVEKGDELIFGHGKEPNTKNQIDINGNSTRTMFSKSQGLSEIPLHHFKKPVSDIITKYRPFFESFKNLKRIIVMGHSLNEIDSPYFMEIVKFAKDAFWILCIRDLKKRYNLQNKLESYGIEKGQIKFSFWEDFEL